MAPPGKTRWPWRRPCPGPRLCARAVPEPRAGRRCALRVRPRPPGARSRPRAPPRRTSTRIPAQTPPPPCSGARPPAPPAAGSPFAKRESGNATTVRFGPRRPAARRHRAGYPCRVACRKTAPVPGDPPAWAATPGSRPAGACPPVRPVPGRPGTGRAGPGRFPCPADGCARPWAADRRARFPESACPVLPRQNGGSSPRLRPWLAPERVRRRPPASPPGLKGEPDGSGR